MEKQSLSQHWDEVYSQKVADQVSWYQRQPQPSLQWIQQLAPQRATKILDVGGGASLLVDALLDEGYSDLTVLDISTAALDTARQRLGEHSGAVRWIAGDIRSGELPPAAFDLWHDRAVFHFLVEPGDRRRYGEQLHRSLRPGGPSDPGHLCGGRARTLQRPTGSAPQRGFTTAGTRGWA